MSLGPNMGNETLLPPSLPAGGLDIIGDIIGSTMISLTLFERGAIGICPLPRRILDAV